jgi:hypothetical protein
MSLLAAMTAPAIYVGLQPGFRQQPPIELYTLLAPVGEHPAGSTVSRQTLEKHGFHILPGRLCRTARSSPGSKPA